MKKIILVTDLGGGDGGKGGVVHKACIETSAHTVIKLGGGQGSHGVRTSRGESFNFSHFGCGTFEGVRTHIPSKMVIDPNALIYEGELLKYQHGIGNVFSLLTLEEDTLCVTPFHRILSRLRELYRKDNPKGTVGTGVGEAVRDSEKYPDLTIRVKDIGKPYLYDKLEALRLQKVRDLQNIILSRPENDSFLDADKALGIELIASLTDPFISSATVESFERLNPLVNIVDSSYLGDKVLSKEGTAVIETSHGVLTDRYYGFHPHTTALRTLPFVALDLLKEYGYDGKVIKLGVTRAYQIRHGAGPMVTEDPNMSDHLLPGSSKEENRWQGKVRVGPLDLVALRYAINVCGGPQNFDGLAVTWFDQIREFGSWKVCDSYTVIDDRNFFYEKGNLHVHPEGYEHSLFYQRALGQELRKCHPDLTTYNFPQEKTEEEMREKLTDLCSEVLKEKLGVPLRMISFGPTEEDKICL